METDRGPKGTKHEGRLRTCLPARVTTREHEARDGQGRQETVDQEWQDWNVVRGED